MQLNSDKRRAPRLWHLEQLSIFIIFYIVLALKNNLDGRKLVSTGDVVVVRKHQREGVTFRMQETTCDVVEASSYSFSFIT